ncbi:RsmE family RNA methyltransferase [Alicyclobacillus shizuokensis]|uniref:RsmE family RNA methyltransferase n=1 Tax=Alicyclobacillus shizuokensis TaxID=392014 RepID=UPI0008343BA5|nr:RsmE family RNA methyltransferase [Alicyclobacillus shizuokensis]
MPRVFLAHPPELGQTIWVDGDEGHHFVRVLRARIGEQVAVVGSGVACLARIVEMDKQAGAFALLPERVLPSHESRVPVYLIQGLAKGDKIDSIIQQATEIGVAGFLLLETERSVARVEPRRAEAKLTRWRRVAREAAAQAQRDVIPSVDLAVTMVDAARWLQSRSVGSPFLLDEAETSHGLRAAVAAVRKREDKAAMAVVVGPEGGWSDAERREWARACDAVPVTLGPRILRTETAGPAAVAAILYELDELGG